MARLALIGYVFPVISIFVVSVLCGNGVQSQVNPGLQFRLSQSVFDHAAKVAVDLLYEEAQKIRIPNQNGLKPLTIGTVDYEVTNMRVTKVVLIKPSTSVVVSPGTITWTLANGSTSIAGNWRYEYNWWFINYGDSGSFNGSVNDVSISLSVSLGLDATGHPTISTIGCNSSITNVSIELNQGPNWLYNLFMGGIKNSIKNQLRSKICGVATTAINGRVNDLLTSFPLQMTVATDYVFDNRFLSAPEIQNAYMDTKHKAAFFYKGDTTNAPIQADPFPTTTTAPNQMLTIWISDYVPNTIGYAIYRRNILRYNLTHRNLPDGFKSCLNTSCSGSCCLGNILPMLSTQYPGASVEVEMAASKAPTTNISSSGIVVTFSGVATFRARLPAGSLVDILTTSVTLNAFVTVTLNSTRIKSNVTKIVPTFAILKGALSSISSSALTRNFEVLVNMFLIPKLNEKGRQGIQLPVPRNVQFKDVALEMQSHCLRITTNVEHKP